MPSKIQLRRGTAAAWTAANPILSNGEPGYETDTKRRKTGDGVTAWNSLAYDTYNFGLGATGSRPSASTAGAGAYFYDTTLHKPIWSDGTIWRDAAGTAV